MQGESTTCDGQQGEVSYTYVLVDVVWPSKQAPGLRIVSSAAVDSQGSSQKQARRVNELIARASTRARAVGVNVPRKRRLEAAAKTCDWLATLHEQMVVLPHAIRPSSDKFHEVL